MQEKKAHILIADDESNILELLKGILENKEFQVSTAPNGEEALKVIRKKSIDIALTDLYMPGGIEGIELLQEIKKIKPETQIIVITGYGTIDSAVGAMKIGAYEYITKPINYDHMFLIIDRILQLKQLQDHNKNLQQQLESRFKFEQIIGKSPKLQSIFGLIRDVAGTASTVLIRGENGTGKELIANAIYKLSKRCDKPIIRVNCAVFAEQLLESELFGHVKGAYTGAIRDRKGRFELAHNGTLFLDEIGEISQSMQVKLLRVLQEGEFERVGSTDTLKVNVRIIAATNKNLEEAIKKGEFRKDLYYRLNVIPLEIPPLRQRLDDIPLLVDHFIAKYNADNNKSIKGITQDALSVLLQYDWPGNVRELENLIERAVVLTKSDYIEKDKVSHLNGSSDFQSPTQMLKLMPLPEVMDNLEKELIENAYIQSNYNQTYTAEALGIHRSTLLSKMSKYGINGKRKNGNGH
ncbi:sigma-54-dependent Fis family transcriptional regulator [candidate division KSB1 bacterium]|nr:sigma-54-dependent Fis family transcriptional regulator [candidate division KSB1 bacterium]